MVSLVEILNLKDKLVGLLHQCLETKSSDFSSSLNSKLAASDNSSPQDDLFFVFTSNRRREMLEICNRITQMLASVRPAAPPNMAVQVWTPPQATLPDPTQVTGSKVDVSAIPLFQLQQVTSSKKNINPCSYKTDEGTRGKPGMRGMKQKDYERVKMAVGFFMGSNPIKPNLEEVAKRFEIRPMWLGTALLDAGIDLPASSVTRFPNLILNRDQASLPTPPKPMYCLAEEVQDQLIEDAEQWKSSGNRETDKTVADVLQRLSAEQQKDVLDFYLKHRSVVSAYWIVHQASVKYDVRNIAMARCLVYNLSKLSGKDIKSERGKKKYLKFADKQNLLLDYARNQKPEDLNVRQMVRMFSIESRFAQNVTLFLKDNGIQVMTAEQKRAKRLADRGLPYTRAHKPELAKQYYEKDKLRRQRQRQLQKMDQSSAGGLKAGLKKAVTKKSLRQTKSSRKQNQATGDLLDQHWTVGMDMETDEAIAELNNTMAASTSHHQGGIRTRQMTNNRYYR